MDRKTVELPIYSIVFARMGGRVTLYQKTTRLKIAMTVPGLRILNKAWPVAEPVRAVLSEEEAALLLSVVWKMCKWTNFYFFPIMCKA